MTIATNVTWASAIKHHPDFQKSTENLGSFASIINDGACNIADKCPRAKSHAALDDKTASKYSNFIAECRKNARAS